MKKLYTYGNVRLGVALWIVCLLCVFSASAEDFVANYLKWNITSDSTCELDSYNKYGGTLIIPETVTYHDTVYTVTSLATAALSQSKVTKVEVSNTVTHIGTFAFYNCTQMTSLKLPCHITSIPEIMCDASVKLQYIAIPSGVTEIGEDAFRDCFGLIGVEFPPSLTILGRTSFGGCKQLKQISLPSAVAEIKDYAFTECKQLKTIISYNLTPPILSETYAFPDDTYANGTLYVPEDAIEAYKSADVWSKFVTIAPITETPSTIIAETDKSTGKIDLQWTSNNTMRIVKDYNVYVSEDGGDFVLWLHNTTKTSATFQGVSGRSYRFTISVRNTDGTIEKYNESNSAVISNLQIQ